MEGLTACASTTAHRRIPSSRRTFLRYVSNTAVGTEALSHHARQRGLGEVRRRACTRDPTRSRGERGGRGEGDRVAAAQERFPVRRGGKTKAAKKNAAEPSKSVIGEELDDAARKRLTYVTRARVASAYERQMRRSAMKAAKIFDAIRRKAEWIDRCGAIRRLLPPCPAEPNDIDSLDAVIVHMHLDAIEVALEASNDIYVAVGLVEDLGAEQARVDKSLSKVDGHRGGSSAGSRDTSRGRGVQWREATGRGVAGVATRAVQSQRAGAVAVPDGVADVEPTDDGVVIVLVDGESEIVPWHLVAARVRKIRASERGVT